MNFSCPGPGLAWLGLTQSGGRDGGAISIPHPCRSGRIIQFLLLKKQKLFPGELQQSPGLSQLCTRSQFSSSPPDVPPFPTPTPSWGRAETDQMPGGSLPTSSNGEILACNKVHLSHDCIISIWLAMGWRVVLSENTNFWGSG